MGSGTTTDDAAIASVKALLDEGQWFLAHDAARTALQQFPGHLKLQQHAAASLVRLGAIDEARRILEPLCGQFHPRSRELAQLYQGLRSAAGFLLRDDAEAAPSPELLSEFADVLDTLAMAREETGPLVADEETLGLLAHVYKDTWRESGRIEDARRCRDTYLHAFRKTGGHWTCINAATMSAVLANLQSGGDRGAGQGDRELARTLATQAVAICERSLATAKEQERFWIWATIGEARLHLQDERGAVAAYQQAMAGGARGDWPVVSARQQLRLMQDNGCDVPAEILNALKLPTIILFTGHMIDKPGRQPPRFPPELEPRVRELIHAALDSLDAKIGYSSGACGADLLFIEAMQEREAETNIVLPFDSEDFIRTSVGFAGTPWVRRFRRALKLAGPLVTYATPEKYLGTVELFQYADRIIHSFAYLRARSLGSAPHLLAVYDGTSPVIQGGTADVVNRWPDKQRLHVIHPPRPTASATVPRAAYDVIAGAPAIAASDARTAAPQTPQGATRVIRTLLFADVVGFSRLQEDHVPYFLYEFLRVISAELAMLPEQPLLVNTWGDAIFAVMREALPLVQYARTLQKAVCDTDWSKLNLPADMSIRIGLHAGPVFEGTDAITRRPNFFGSHVNRAARLEPVTLPGHIYASQQFVGLLTAEQRAREEPNGGWPFHCEALGTLSLSKGFGVWPVYHIRNRYGG